MVNVFIKRFWGFGAHWPIVSFSLPGSLYAMLEKSKAGDLMAFVGTKGSKTMEHEQGRLLGLAEFGRTRVRSREVLPPKSFADAEKGPNGDVKWPHAVMMTRAWRFTDDPLPMMTQILGGQLPMSAIKNAVLLSPDRAGRILALPRAEFDVGLTEAIRAERAAISSAVGPSGTMGPIPTSYSYVAGTDASRPASTYVFQFGALSVWKVGWAHDPADRLRQLNKHVPDEVLGQKWGGGWIQKWASAVQAHDMEQKVLAAFADSVKYGERVHCTKPEIEAAWRKAWTET